MKIRKSLPLTIWVVVFAIARLALSADIRPIRSFEISGSRVQRIWFTPDSQTLLVAPLQSKKLFLLEKDGFQKTRPIDLPNTDPYCVWLKGSMRCAMFRDTEFDIVSLSDGLVVQTHKMEEFHVWDGVCSADGEYVAVCGKDIGGKGAWILFRTKDWTEEFRLTGAPKPVKSISLSDNGERVRFTSENGVSEWSKGTQTISTIVDGSSYAKFRETVSRDRIIHYWYDVEAIDLPTRVRHTLPGTLPGEPPRRDHQTFANAAVWIPNTQLVAVGYNGGGFAVWDVSVYKRVFFFETVRNTWDVNASANGAVIAGVIGPFDGKQGEMAEFWG